MNGSGKIFLQLKGKIAVADECINPRILATALKFGACSGFCIPKGTKDTLVKKIVSSNSDYVFITADRALAGSMTNSILIPSGRGKRLSRHTKGSTERKITRGFGWLDGSIEAEAGLPRQKSVFWDVRMCPVCTKPREDMAANELDHVKRHALHQKLRVRRDDDKEKTMA